MDLESERRIPGTHTRYLGEKKKKKYIYIYIYIYIYMAIVFPFYSGAN